MKMKTYQQLDHVYHVYNVDYGVQHTENVINVVKTVVVSIFLNLA
jgi:hypothetical protein